MREDHDFFAKAVGLVWRDIVITQAHIGASSYVLVGKDGIFYKVEKPAIDFFLHIQEFDLSYRKTDGTPAYNINILNQKLTYLVGNRDLYRMVEPYSTIVREAVDSLANYGGADYDTGVLNAMGAVVASDSVLREIRTGMQSSEPESREIAARASRGLALLQAKGIVSSDRFDSLPYYANPLIVWAAAAISNFFTDAELPGVLSYLRKTFILTEDSFYGAGAIASCLNVLRHNSVQRFVNFVLSMRDGIHAPDASFIAFRDGLSRCGWKIELARAQNGA